MQVAEIRERMGLSQTDLAELVGVTQPAVAAWEAGRRRPTGAAGETLERIAAALTGPTRSYGRSRGRPIDLPAARWTPVVPADRVVTLPHHLDWTPRRGRRDPQ